MILVCSGKLCLSTNAPDPVQFDRFFQHKIVNLETEFCYVTHISVIKNMVSYIIVFRFAIDFIKIIFSKMLRKEFKNAVFPEKFACGEPPLADTKIFLLDPPLVNSISGNGNLFINACIVFIPNIILFSLDHALDA